MIMNYTIEQFESEYNNCYSVEAKRDVLEKALDNLDVTDSEVSEILKSYKDDFKDLYDEMKIEEDQRCNYDIESGIAELYVCIKEFTDKVGREFKEGSNYYIKVDDVKSIYVPKGTEDEIPDFIKDYVAGIRPIAYIYLDNGIGTLKFKHRLLTEENFGEVFQKVSPTKLN